MKPHNKYLLKNSLGVNNIKHPLNVNNIITLWGFV